MRTALCLLFLAGLTACAPVESWHQNGVSLAQLTQDQTACEVAAAKDVPPNTQTRRTPVQYHPPRQVCHKSNGKTHCHVRDGYFTGGERYTVDTNAPLRKRVVFQCMSAKGYSEAEAPRCTGDALERVGGKAAQLAPLTEASCAAKTNAGIWAIVTPE